MKKVLSIAIPMLFVVAGGLSLLMTTLPYASNPMFINPVWYASAVVAIVIALAWRIPQENSKEKGSRLRSLLMSVAIIVVLAIVFVGVLATNFLTSHQNWQLVWMLAAIGGAIASLNGLVAAIIWVGVVQPRFKAYFSLTSGILTGALFGASWLTLGAYANEFVYLSGSVDFAIAAYFLWAFSVMLAANLLYDATKRYLGSALLIIGSFMLLQVLNSAYMVGAVSGSGMVPLATWSLILLGLSAMLWQQNENLGSIAFDPSLMLSSGFTILSVVGVLIAYQSPSLSQPRIHRFLEQTSLFSERVDWETLPADTSIEDVLAVLNDPHTVYFTAEEAQTLATGGSSSQYGLRILNPGAVVAMVTADGSAEAAGILPGDIVLAVNGEAPTSDGRSVRLSGEGVELTIARDDETFEVTLTSQSENLSSLPQTMMIEDCVAYIEITATLSALAEYYETVWQFLDETDDTVCGYIIDLRRNRGGNIYAMMAAIGSIAGEGTLASLVLPNGETHIYNYQAGQAFIDDTAVSGATYEPSNEERTNLPVAVLTSPITASSGEIASILFRGRENAHIFGTETAGVPTSTDFVWLADGSKLGVTGASIADRTGYIYEPAPLMPQTQTQTDWAAFGTIDDPTIEAALEWLYGA